MSVALHELTDIALHEMTDEGRRDLVLQIVSMMEPDDARDTIVILMALQKSSAAVLPSIEALGAIRQSITASLEKRRLGKNVIEGEGRIAFEEAQQWVALNVAILQELTNG